MTQSGGTVHVLIAEDNEDHLFLARRALQAVEGVAVTVAGVRDGQEALDYLEGKPPFEDRVLPNLIFLDLAMPRRSGLEVTERIKADPALRHIPVVMLTSSDRPEDVESAYRNGINNYVTKSGPDGLRSIADHWAAQSRLPNPDGD